MVGKSSGECQLYMAGCNNQDGPSDNEFDCWTPRPNEKPNLTIG